MTVTDWSLLGWSATNVLQYEKSQDSPTSRNEVMRTSIWLACDDRYCVSKYAILIERQSVVPRHRDARTSAPLRLSPREDSAHFTVLCRIAENWTHGFRFTEIADVDAAQILRGRRNPISNQFLMYPLTRIKGNLCRFSFLVSARITCGLGSRKRVVQRTVIQRNSAWKLTDEDECLPEWVDHEITSDE